MKKLSQKRTNLLILVCTYCLLEVFFAVVVRVLQFIVECEVLMLTQKEMAKMTIGAKPLLLLQSMYYLRTNVNRRALLGGINSRISVISAQYVGLLSAHVEGVRPGKIERYTKSQPDLQLR